MYSIPTIRLICIVNIGQYTSPIGRIRHFWISDVHQDQMMILCEDWSVLGLTVNHRMTPPVQWVVVERMEWGLHLKELALGSWSLEDDTPLEN